MDENEEYERLVGEQSAAQSDLDDAHHDYLRTQDKLERLRSVRQTLYDCCDSFRGVKKSVRRVIRDDYDWTGENFSRFSTYSSSLMDENDAYCRNLDAARDAINDEITRLENDMYRQEGLIGYLRALLNSLANEIQNLFN